MKWIAENERHEEEEKKGERADNESVKSESQFLSLVEHGGMPTTMKPLSLNRFSSLSFSRLTAARACLCRQGIQCPHRDLTRDSPELKRRNEKKTRELRKGRGDSRKKVKPWRASPLRRRRRKKKRPLSSFLLPPLSADQSAPPPAASFSPQRGPQCVEIFPLSLRFLVALSSGGACALERRQARKRTERVSLSLLLLFSSSGGHSCFYR